MGAVEVEMKLENYGDRYEFLGGKRIEAEVRRHTMIGLVDTGARMLALPEDVVDILGLRELRRTIVGYADGRREERPIVGPIMLTMAGRNVLTEAICLPPTLTALIGEIPLEGTDLHVDCAHQRLIPDPQSPIYPLMDLK